MANIVAEHETMSRIEKYEQQKSISGKDTEILRMLATLLQEFQRCRMSFIERHFGEVDEVSTYRETEVTRAC